eukprot:scaffold113_cov50-Cyclotella_meneghiniana.AAC.2
MGAITTHQGSQPPKTQTNILEWSHSSKHTESGNNIEPTGDPLTKRNPDDGILRFGSNNINGIKITPNGVIPEIDTIDELGFDIMAYQETKIPWTQNNTRQYNQQMQFKWPHGVRSTFSSAPSKYDDSNFQPGGTLLTLHSKTKGRVLEQGSDPLGRFCWMTLRGARDEGILVISAYRVCHTLADNPGPFTAFHQQYTAFREKGIEKPDPRQLILTDLTSLISEKRTKGFRPILMMDANEDWVKKSHPGNKLEEFMNDTQLIDPFYEAFKTSPRTYVNGSNRLDYILIDAGLQQAIRRQGYLGNLDANMSDHTMCYIDFDEKALFRGLINRPSEIHAREFLIEQDDKKLKFTTTARTQFLQHNIAERVFKLAAAFSEHGATDMNIATYQTLDKQIMEIVKCSMKKAARKDFGYMRSPDLTTAGQMLMLYKCIHSCKLRRQDAPQSLVKSAARLEVNIQDAMLMTVSQLRKAVTRRRKELWAIQKDCEQRRSNWIATLAEDRARAAGDRRIGRER